MSNLRLGLNTCFTATRWPDPEDKFRLVRKLGLDVVQYSLDSFDPGLPAAYRKRLARSIRSAAERHGVAIHSTFTGAGHHYDNLLFHPDPAWRANALRWFSAAVQFSAEIGAEGAGGFVGALSLPDEASAATRARRHRDARAALVQISRVCADCGLAFFMVEPMSVKREPPSTIAEALDLVTEVNRRAAAPIRLCLDVGHCRAVSAPTAADRNPYAWLRRCGHLAPCVHLHQTDHQGSRHWPFTPAHNRKGMIDGARILDAIRASGAESMVLLIELFFSPYEPADERALTDLKTSVAYWKQCLAEHGK